MKTIETIKKFDAVKMMRDIRNQIDMDIEGMTFEQEKEYFKKGAERAKKYRTVGNNF
ncbi:MAG: hypothetical protein AAGA66_20445 [Bacteroidota bacterium]